VSSLLRGIFGFLFGNNKDNNESQNRQKTTYQKPKSKKKIFDKSDGEYVEFEEVQ
jgi:hypothetical protein